MSDLVATSQDGKDLLALAETLGIDINNDMSEVYQSEQNQGTTFLHPQNVRRAYDLHNSGGVMQWTAPDFKGKIDEREAELLFEVDPDGGEPKEITGITEVRGIVVSYQQQDRLSYYDGEKTITKCSVIGYTDQNTGESLKKLPSTPYGNKYKFHKPNGKWEINHTDPNPVVGKVGVIGMRGERPTSCAECIKCGLSTEVVTMPDGAEKTISCEARGKLYIAVYEVVTKKRIKNPNADTVKAAPKFLNEEVSIPLTNIVDFDGESLGDFILIEIPMSRSSISGKYMKDPNTGKKDPIKSVDGYESYCKSLIYGYKNPRDPRRNSVVHFTGLSFPKHPAGAPTHMAHFRSLGTGTQDQIMDAVKFWQSETPEEDVSTLEVKPVQSIADSASPTLNTTATVVPSMKTVEVVEDNTIEDSELPF